LFNGDEHGLRAIVRGFYSSYVDYNGIVSGSVGEEMDSSYVEIAWGFLFDWFVLDVSCRGDLLWWEDFGDSGCTFHQCVHNVFDLVLRIVALFSCKFRCSLYLACTAHVGEEEVQSLLLADHNQVDLMWKDVSDRFSLITKDSDIDVWKLDWGLFDVSVLVSLEVDYVISSNVILKSNLFDWVDESDWSRDGGVDSIALTEDCELSLVYSFEDLEVEVCNAKFICELSVSVAIDFDVGNKGVSSVKTELSLSEVTKDLRRKRVLLKVPCCITGNLRFLNGGSWDNLSCHLELKDFINMYCLRWIFIKEKRWRKHIDINNGSDDTIEVHLIRRWNDKPYVIVPSNLLYNKISEFHSHNSFINEDITVIWSEGETISEDSACVMVQHFVTYLFSVSHKLVSNWVDLADENVFIDHQIKVWVVLDVEVEFDWCDELWIWSDDFIMTGLIHWEDIWGFKIVFWSPFCCLNPISVSCISPELNLCSSFWDVDDSKVIKGSVSISICKDYSWGHSLPIDEVREVKIFGGDGEPIRLHESCGSESS
jgi:hypothetical protein